jgi:4'-phosphopantetheinyl transferase EntD
MTIHPLLADLTGPDFAIGWAPLEALSGDPHPDEWEDIASAAPNRQKEFVAGRQLARALSGQLGLPPAPLRRGEHRAPIWPNDRTGSLSHCDTLCVAAVGKRNAVQSVGVDVETIGRVEQKLWPTLFTEKEADYFSSLAPDTVALETTLFFSAKESFFKCQYPLTQEWVGFQDVEITRTDSHTLAIAPTRSAAQAWHAAPIHTVEINKSHVATVMLLRA